MKHTIILITILLFSQMTHSQKPNDSYETLWKQVEKLEQEALTKSALKVVNVISNKAKKEKNTVQSTKALLYTSKYALILDEDAQLNIITDFKNEIGKADFPTKNVLESFLANLCWQYFQQNRYRFYNRTNTENKVNSSDFRTWDLTTLFEEICLHFENSLENPTELQQLELTDFKDILHQQKGSKIFRPTLFDILANTALDFYKSSENSITKVADKFEIDNPEILCEATSFTNLQISSTNPESMMLKALNLYQQLVVFHAKTKNLEALTYVDLERLRFIHENAVFKNKDEQYLEVLQNSATQYKDLTISALYQYKIANLYNLRANTYSPTGDTNHQWKRKEALELCETVIKKFPDSRGAKKCKALKSTILEKSLQLTTEKYIPTNMPSRLLVNYKNISDLQLTAYHVSQNQIKKLNDFYRKEEILSYIQKLKVAKQWNATLKNEKDYQSHSTEVLLPALENGLYLILATDKENATNTFAFSQIQVTDLALVETNTKNHKIFQIINRNNGSPMAGAKVDIAYQIGYRGSTHNKTFVSDKMGMVKIPLTSERWNNINITINHNKEKAFFGNYYKNQSYHPEKTDITTYKSFLFTDRSIYRPGQPLYFKGIIIENFKNESNVAPNENVFISLHDVNGQKISELDFETNDYGSFNGKFILPTNVLTGEFHLELYSAQGLARNNHYFSVEEYKRPKFETSFAPVTETFKVNDSVSVKGTAKAYAGSDITDAKVAYRIKRVVHYPRWYYWSRPYFNSNPQEIAHGETTTDASGNYAITFNALPDNSVSKESLPVFTYQISADVTDINGETHSSSTTVRVGYHALTANISVNGQMDKDKNNNVIHVSTNNLNGQFVPAIGTLKVYKLEAPEHVLRNQPWEAPDYKMMDKKEFKALFPHDAYAQEHTSMNWKKGKLVLEKAFDTEKSQEIVLGNIKKWESGKYSIEIETKDKYGQDVKDMVLTTLYGKKDKQLADNQLFNIKVNKDSYTHGEDAKITFSSAAKNIAVTVFVEKDRKIVATHLIELNGNSKTISVPVTKEDVGGFAITYSFSAFNSFQSNIVNISVPYPSSSLRIETLTFRDKLQPGTNEKWTFKIKGPKGDKVAAELLASMYDASLDAFKYHSWDFSPLSKPNYYSNQNSNAYQSFGVEYFRTYVSNTTIGYKQQYFDTFNWFGFHFGYENRNLRFARGLLRKSAPIAMDMLSNETEIEEVAFEMQEPMDASLDEAVIVGYGISVDKENDIAKKEPSFDGIQIRKNLQETAFFFPQLRTDKDGNVSFEFTTPEALTKWKVQLLAHTKNLESTTMTLETVTQKELMVLPNPPRFLREGDNIMFSTKISNLTENALNGFAQLQLVDAVTGKEIDNLLDNINKSQNFTVDAKGNTSVSWSLTIPENKVQAVQYRIVAKAGDFSDGEQNALPVLSNRMLVTETLPMWIRSNETKTFTLDKLKNTSTTLSAGSSTTLSNHKLTLEVTSNPAWYAVQALPYLMEYPYECSEQTFARFYANALATHIASSNPRIQEVFKQWASSDALLSNLEKNQELKSLIIQETPWLRDAQSETEQKKRIALLFDLNKMKNELENALNKLEQMQMSNGGFPWFKGSRYPNRYITQHIASGFGHLSKLGVTSNTDEKLAKMLSKAVKFLDNEILDDYNNLLKWAAKSTDKNYLKKNHLGHFQLQYLYMRSFYSNIKMNAKVKTAVDYYYKQSATYWTDFNLYSKGMIALVQYRNEDATVANKILKVLKENSITNEELGMYWKANTASWYWYQAPIETQSLLIEAFSEIENDIETIDNLKIWLLKNKQTNRWKTTKATTEAIYALLLQGTDWLEVTDFIEVKIGNTTIDPLALEETKVEAGTGYFKTSFSKGEITPEMATVTLTKNSDGIAWGALYWQYFEDLDKITSAETPLKLSKKLFLKKNTDKGEQLSEINENTSLKLGDLVRVRIELRVDRPMEFVHMKDMRASGLEPINVLSQYKWQDGLGYYESTKDASTNFFFDQLPKGIFVFEYDLRVNNAGDFSNGITTIQSMYAPEFSSHSEGIRVKIQQFVVLDSKR